MKTNNTISSRISANLEFKENILAEPIPCKAPYPEIVEGFYGVWRSVHPEKYGKLVGFLDEYSLVCRAWATQMFIDLTSGTSKYSEAKAETVVVSSGEAADLMLRNKAMKFKAEGKPQEFWEFLRSWSSEVSKIDSTDAHDFENDIYTTLSEFYENRDKLGRLGLKLRIIPVSMDHLKLDAVIERTSGVERRFDIALYYRQGEGRTRRNLLNAIRCIAESLAEEKQE